MNRRLGMVLGLLSVAVLARVAPAESASVIDVDTYAVRPAGLDITQGEAFQTADGRLAFRITFADVPDPERLRIMIDVSGAAAREPSTGAAFMLEGAHCFRYPEGAKDWTWTEIPEPPVIVPSGRTLICVLPAVAAISDGSWFAVTTKPDLSLADRLPNTGKVSFVLAQLPKLSLKPAAVPEDLGALLDNEPRSLSVRIHTTINGRIWEVLEEAQRTDPAWQPAFMSTSLPIVVYLTDAVTGKSEALKADKQRSCDEARRWSGTALGVNWDLIVEPTTGEGDVVVTGLLHGDKDRCLRVDIGAGISLAGCTWHDDVRFHRAVTATAGIFENVREVPYGCGRQSVYPFGVLSTSNGTFVAETDPDEPRVFQVVADPARSFFGIYYDLALTAMTSNFPGEATFCVALRSMRGSDAAFRRALAGFYSRNPDFYERRVPEAGIWMPFSNPATIRDAADFGFGFYEKDESEQDLTYCEASKILTFVYTEPWLYRLPMRPGMERVGPQALRLMELYSLRGDRQGDLASSALLGVVRRPDGTILMDFTPKPGNPGARMEVNTDPDTRTDAEHPISRAMSDWRFVKQQVVGKGIDGICLDSMSDMVAVDYNPAAIGVADYPCTYQQAVLKPGIPTTFPAYEYVAAVSRALRPKGKYLMGNGACTSPFFSRWIDVLGEEFDWSEESRFQQAGDMEMNARRALAGGKPFAVLMEVRFADFEQPKVEEYFRECMFWGFLPSFFCREGEESYWGKASWFDRDRSLFKSYVPLIRRLAMSGWQPVGGAVSDSADIWVENFNSADSAIKHVTVRNVTNEARKVTLVFPPFGEPVVVLDPLSGACRLVDPKVTFCSLALAGSELGTRDFVPLSALGEELTFMTRWSGGQEEGEHVQKTLESIRNELNMGVECESAYAIPAVRGERNEVSLAICNRGTQEVAVADFKIIATTHFRPFGEKPVRLGPGETGTLKGSFDTNDVVKSPWIEIGWALQSGTNDLIGTRMIKPSWVDALEFSVAATNIEAAGNVAVIEVTIRNNTAREQLVNLSWEGDFHGDRFGVTNR